MSRAAVLKQIAQDTESQSHQGWRRLSRPWGAHVNPTCQVPSLNRVPQCHMHVSLKYLQGWRLLCFPWHQVNNKDPTMLPASEWSLTASSPQTISPANDCASGTCQWEAWKWLQDPPASSAALLKPALPFSKSPLIPGCFPPSPGPLHAVR